MQKYEVEVSSVDSNQLSDVIAKNCFFCHKLVRGRSEAFDSIQKLTGDKFYCSFCVRHNFHYKTNRNVLLMSYRGIIGYYYLFKYLESNYKSLWWSDIKLCIDNHVEIGMANPVFTYDPSTFMWFIDFNRVGSSGKKIPISTVEETTQEMMNAFKLREIACDYTYTQMWEKFRSALQIFYQNRQRPPDRRMLIPTFYKCYGSSNKPEDFERTRNFLNRHFLIK